MLFVHIETTLQKNTGHISVTSFFYRISKLFSEEITSPLSRNQWHMIWYSLTTCLMIQFQAQNKFLPVPDWGMLSRMPLPSL